MCPFVLLSVTSPPVPLEVPYSAPGPDRHNSLSLFFSMAALWLRGAVPPPPASSLSSFWVSVSDPLFVLLSLLLAFLPSVSPASIFPQQASIDSSLDARRGPAPFWALCLSLPPCCPLLSLPPHRPPALPPPQLHRLQHWYYSVL